ncbi:YcaO-like family protein [Thermococcus sp.]
MDTIYYPFFTYQLERFKRIAGQHAGILEASLITSTKIPNAPAPYAITGKMPNYHKIVIDLSSEVEYHLSGYGMSYEECLVKYIGESVERYAVLLASEVFKDEIIYATYNELERKGEEVMPFEYLKLFSDYEIFKNSPLRISEPSKNDVIGWIKCPSLFKSNREIYTPAQVLFIGYLPMKYNEKRYLPAFSTGTASHLSLENALLGSLMEWIEIDAVMTRWYTKLPSPRIIIDDQLLSGAHFEILREDSPYEVVPLYMSLPDLPIHVFGVFLINRRLETPYILFGSQSSFNPVAGLYRGLMEAAAILYLGTYGYLTMPAKYFIESGPFVDLDKNVAFYSHPTRIKEKKELIESLVSEDNISLSSLKDLSTGSTKDDLKYVIKQLKTISHYGVYLDITPPELQDKGIYVTRTFIPELCNMCLPGFPYTNHPRLNKYGGVKNAYPHPLP